MPGQRAAAAKLAKAVPVFTALGDETRLSIVSRLGREGPLSISRLTDGTGLTRQAVTKHLGVLADADLVRGRRRGRERIWRINARRLEEVRGYLRQVSAQWDDAIARLQAAVENESD